MRASANSMEISILFVLGRCSYSSGGTDLVSSVGVPLGGAKK